MANNSAAAVESATEAVGGNDGKNTDAVSAGDVEGVHAFEVLGNINVAHWPTGDGSLLQKNCRAQCATVVRSISRATIGNATALAWSIVRGPWSWSRSFRDRNGAKGFAKKHRENNQPGS
jgi:hypothetical protein